MAPPDKSTRITVLTQWLGLAIALSILGGAVAFNLYREYDQQAALEQERLSSKARIIALNLERHLASANLMLEGIRDDLPNWKRSSGLQVEMRHLKALITATPGIRYIGVMDAKGTLLASSLPQFSGRNFGYRDYFQTVKRRPAANTLYVSPPFEAVNGPYVINVTRMIAGPRGEFAGVITATFDPDYFKSLMTSVLYSPDMWDGIVHGDGVLFLMVPERKGLPGTNLAQPGSFFTRHRDSGLPITVLSGTVYATQEERMMAQHTVQPAALAMDKPLVVAVSRDLDAIFQPWRRDALIQGGLFGLLVIVSSLGLHAFQRRQQVFDQRAAEAATALRQSAERLQLAAEASGVGVWDHDLTTGGLVWDDAMYAIYGIDCDTVSNLYDAWRNSVLPEDLPEVDAALEATIAQGAPFAPRFRIRRGDGAICHVQARARLYADADGKPMRMVGTNEDITERQQQQAILQDSETRFRLTFEVAAIGMMLVSPKGRFLRVNDALCRIVGYTQAELQQKTFQDITHPDDLEADRVLIQELLAGTRDHYQLEKRYFHKDGHVIWILLSGSTVRDSRGKVLYFIAQVQDITERKAMLEELQRQATKDYLTGLSNRRHFMEQGENELAQVQRYGHALSLLMLDIDHFKNINDSYGHKAGDIVLQKLSQILRETLRTVDIIGRMGGEEFVVLLPETDLQEAVEVAERLREIVAGTEVIREAGLPLRFTISIGVVTMKQKHINLDILLNQADQALYKAKTAGRNKVCVAA